jgi:concanavalin A-like lectin/glucanase superfamily protein/uncharacterized protein DUF2341
MARNFSVPDNIARIANQGPGPDGFFYKYRFPFERFMALRQFIPIPICILILNSGRRARQGNFMDWLTDLLHDSNRSLRAIPLFASVLHLAPITPAAQAQPYPAWIHSLDLYYDTSPDRVALTGNVLDFPVLVRLTNADFPFAEARDSGQDLRFSKPDGTPLDFEIDRYDPVAGKAEIWVRMDTVKADYKGRLARLHWGNPTAASASSPNDVFTGSNGFVSVWHLRGQFPTPRLNSVAGGKEAVPLNYDNNEQTAGIIGYADSLDGGASGDYLQTWEPFSDLSQGFTFSIWAYPTAAGPSAHFMDFGNGPARDNLVLCRGGATADLVFESYHTSAVSSVRVPEAITLNQWQYFAVTVAGKSARIYRNGSLLASATLNDTLINGLRRENNYLGKSNGAADAYFMGKLDEPVVSKTARSADWIKLGYANQKADQVLVTFVEPPTCQPRFGLPPDTTIDEGALLALAGWADCADHFEWSVVSGPAPRLLDPEVKVLNLAVPRVSGDTLSEFRFTAGYGDSTESGTVRVSIRDVIPDPRFTLPADLAWDGKDSLLLKATVENRAAIEASSQPALSYAWTLGGMEADTSWRSGGLLLKSAAGNGILTVGLCIHNNGPAICKEIAVTVTAVPVSIAKKKGNAPSQSFPGYRADGRRVGSFSAEPARPGPGPGLYP